MSLYEKLTFVNHTGEKQTFTAGPLSKSLEVQEHGNMTCVTKQDAFDLTKETTCLQRPDKVIVKQNM